MAVEQRCTDLGANCIASEPLNTNSYAYDGNWCNPADTTGSDKQMTIGGSTGNVFENESGGNMSTWSFPSSGALFTALPNISPSVNFLAQGGVGAGVGHPNFIGHVFSGSDPTARRSMRWYQYFSSAWTITTGSCLNSGKLYELGPTTAPMVMTSSGVHSIYGWQTSQWNTGIDCCSEGPGSQAFAYDSATMNGKWWRFEFVVRNALSTGSVTIIELWRKNVTDNGANVKVLDTADTTYSTGSPAWGTTQATTLKPTSRLDQFYITGWRNGTCTGFLGYTHLLAAAWSTDAGQFIGAASEIEGGAPATNNARSVLFIR